MSLRDWEHLKNYKDAIIDGTAIALVWQADDVEMRAEERDIELTPEQVGDILHLLDHKHDASLGVSWDTIDYYIDEAVE